MMDSTIREAEMPARAPPLHQFSRPLPGDHTNIVRDPDFKEIIWATIRREAEMFARDLSLHLFSPPLPKDHTDIFGSEIHITEKMRNFAAKHLGERLQAMPAIINLPPGVPPDPKIPAQHQFMNKIPFRANLLTDGIVIQERTASANLHRLRAPVPNMQPQFMIQFINKVQNPSFTTNLVRDDNGSPIKVGIYDTSTQSIISPDNFLSSAKVKIIVLNAEFVENKGETLSRVVFNQSVLRERERKGPILTGRSHIIQLENGFGTFENIVFNDNSSWTKSGFRLGVMVVSDGEEGYFNGERVQEGVSEPFRVKDRRMKASQKPDRLKLTHKVQSLKKIGKDRAFLLQKKNINTVEDFLKIYNNDEPALREILCIKSESGKEWDSMVEHAMQCADEFHAKYNALNNSIQPQQASVHPMERNMPLSTNGGRLVVDSGSSKPNPSENDRIEGDMPASNRQQDPSSNVFPFWNDFLEPLSSDGDVNTPCPMEDFGVSGGGGGFGGPCSIGNDGGVAWIGIN